MTFLGLPDGLRLGCNRDELRTRAPAEPPRALRFGGRAALLPIDPQGGGTWIAVNDAGLVMALLNRYPDSLPVPSGPVSRGEIIPSLLHHERLEDAVAAAARLPTERYAPFRLLLADRSAVVEVVERDGRLTVHPERPLSRPLLFTSSGLGDLVVEGPRRALFEEMFGDGPGDVATQDAFHAHCWCEQPLLSVRMEHPVARTVSHCFVELGAREAVMRYREVEAPPEAEHVARLAL